MQRRVWLTRGEVVEVVVEEAGMAGGVYGDFVGSGHHNLIGGGATAATGLARHRELVGTRLLDQLEQAAWRRRRRRRCALRFGGLEHVRELVDERRARHLGAVPLVGAGARGGSVAEGAEVGGRHLLERLELAREDDEGLRRIGRVEVLEQVEAMQRVEEWRECVLRERAVLRTSVFRARARRPMAKDDLRRRARYLLLPMAVNTL